MANNNHFELTLDTLAPSGSITRPALYMNANANLTIVKGDASFMKVWFNGNQTGTKSDATYPSSPEAAAETKMTNFSADGRYYYHMTLIDDVNNESAVFDTQEIVFDATRPTVSNIVLADPDSGSTEITNNLTVDFSFDYSDGSGLDVSGVNLARVSCADWAQPQEINLTVSATSYSGQLTFTSDGSKTVSVVVVDRAGNESVAGTQTIYVDTGLEKPVLTLQTSAGATLPAYINYHSINVHLTSHDTDINGYKIWEGASEPADYTPYTPDSNPFEVLIQNMNLSSGDGLKTIHAKVRDVAGNEDSADDATVTIDTVLPTVTISSDRSIISNVTGYTTAVLMLSGTDAAGVKAYELKCGNTVIASTLPIPATFNLTSANSMAEGSNTITLTVVDNADNQNSATCTVILDTTAPTVALTSPINVWHNSQFDVAVTLGDANAFVANQAKLWAWTSTSSSATDPGATAPITSLSLGNFTINSSSIGWGLAQSEQNYLHIKLVDNVGNVAYLHEVFKYDSQIGDPSVAFSSSVYSSTAAQVRVTLPVDDVSGITKMRITGDITDGTAANTWETIPQSGNRDVTLTTGDGMKSVSIQVMDEAGNISNVVAVDTPCELDTTIPTAGLALYEADGSTSKAARSPIETLSARITVDDDSIGNCEYKIYGDFTFGSQSAQGIDEADAAWTTFTPDSGVAYKLISDMYCTSGDGDKHIYVKVRDNAGHVSSAVGRSFVYDTTAIDVDVYDADYNRVSKIHALRRNSGGEISGHYADECNFKFAPHVEADYYQAYKVVAYSSAEAAAAGSYLDDPIKQSGDAGSAGSIHMHATGLNQNTEVVAMIKGADLEAAVNDGEDGIKIIVVYMQDLAGQWSEAANFEVSL